MDKGRIAREVLAAVGGCDNVIASDVCMTRLRILTEQPSLVDLERLSLTQGVLGIIQRGPRGIEVVFSPGRVEGVQEQLVTLTGKRPDGRAFIGAAPTSTASLQVRVSPKDREGRTQWDEDAATEAALTPDEPPIVRSPDDITDLASLLDTHFDVDDEEEPEDEDYLDAPAARVVVINGPNINMLGIREPSIYGRQDYQALLGICHSAAREAGFDDCVCLQSNHEGDLVDFIQDALGSCDGIVINPAAYTHTSVAILDAVRAVSLPTVEVHISRIDEREEFRKVSYIRQACFETVCGMGLEGYRKAIHDLARHLGITPSEDAS